MRGLQRNRHRLAVASVTVTCLGLLAVPQPVEGQTRRIERPAFAIDLPDWQVVADEGRAGLGKYKVAADSGKRTAEISWHGGEPASPPRRPTLKVKTYTFPAFAASSSLFGAPTTA